MPAAPQQIEIIPAEPLEGEQTQFNVSVTSPFGGSTPTITLIANGAKVDEQTLDIPSNGTRTANLTYTPPEARQELISIQMDGVQVYEDSLDVQPVTPGETDEGGFLSGIDNKTLAIGAGAAGVVGYLASQR
jgi:hypothetical protein